MSSQLRNRKTGGSTSSCAGMTQEDVSSSDNNKNSGDHSPPTEAPAAAIRVTPLRQRFFLLRMDVAPFLILYSMLIFADVVVIAVPLLLQKVLPSLPLHYQEKLYLDLIPSALILDLLLRPLEVPVPESVMISLEPYYELQPIYLTVYGILQFLLSIALGGILFLHFVVVLAATWSIQIQALVGYSKYIEVHSVIETQESTVKVDWKHLKQLPTHALVMDAHDESSAQASAATSSSSPLAWFHLLRNTLASGGGGAGSAQIVELTVQTLGSRQAIAAGTASAKAVAGDITEIDDDDDDDINDYNNETVALVGRYQDRTFRAVLQSPDEEDLDVTLWKPALLVTTIAPAMSRRPSITPQSAKPKAASSLSFRFLRYPVDLPLTFYNVCGEDSDSAADAADTADDVSGGETNITTTTYAWQGHPHWPSILTASQLYGPNTTQLSLPSFLELLVEQITAPFFLFQLLCVLLWMCDEYWYYALYTLLALLVFEATVAYNRLQSLQRLYQAGHKGSDRIWVRRPALGAERFLLSNGNRRRVSATNIKHPSNNQQQNTMPPHAWMNISTAELVPGDIVSISTQTGNGRSDKNRYHGINSSSKKNHHGAPQSSLHRNVPADILLLNGTAVCDEALLNGESIPQLKHALEITTTMCSMAAAAAAAAITEKELEQPLSPPQSPQRTTKAKRKYSSKFVATVEPCLDMSDNQHKESILFAGTTLLAVTPEEEGDMAGGSGETNDADFEAATPDGGAMGMVLRTGFETLQGNLLRAMAHSSNASRGGVHNLDTFVFISMLLICAITVAGYVLWEGYWDERRNRFRLMLHVIIIITSVVPPELPMELSLAVTNSVADLMKRCKVYCTEHYRIPFAGEIDLCCFDKTGTLTSDEMMLKGVRLPFNESTNGNKSDDIKAASKNGSNHKKGDVKGKNDEDDALLLPSGKNVPWPTLRVMAGCHALATTGASIVSSSSKKKNSTPTSIVGDPLEQAVLKHTGFRLMGNNLVALDDPVVAGEDASKAISILHRFAFSSKLKRMTVLVTEEGGQGVVWALTKGAPETIKEFLTEESVPENYDDVSFHHMSRGRRVLAMAYREVGKVKKLKDLKTGGRDPIERDLTFAGFLVLDCPLKPDSKAVISELKKSGHGVVMITGDAILTAAEVARQVGIMKKSTESKNRTAYQVLVKPGATVKSDVLEGFQCSPLVAKGANEKSLELSLGQIKTLRQRVKNGEVFFVISGDVLVNIASAAVNLAYKLNAKNLVLDEKHTLLHPAAQAVLAELVPIISVFARHAPHQKEAVVAAFNRGGFHTLMCGDGTNDVGALKRAHVGISIISDPDVELKQREASAALAEQKKAKKTDKRAGDKTSIEKALRQMREAQEELDYVELGDASVAAPFTSRAVSIKCCKDVIQQGRCTLVTMLSIYKILGINCLVNAMVLSKLFLHGVKQGDRQLTALGIAVAALFYFVTRAQPLSTLSVIRPPSSVLCIQALMSISTQFSIHCIAILLVTEAALSFVDPYDPSLVPDGPFNPNVLNSATFIMTCIATLNTFAVNYRGRPFMADLRENKFLYRSLQVFYAILMLCAMELFSPLNDLLQLTPMPPTSDHEFEGSYAILKPLHDLVKLIGLPVFLCVVMVTDTALVFITEKIIQAVLEGRASVSV